MPDANPPERLPPRLRAAVALLTEHGLRVSEVVRLRASDVTGVDTLDVRLSKGNGRRIVTDAEIVAALRWHPDDPPGRPLVPYTVAALRSTCERLGLAYRPPGAVKRRVTHAGRARYAQRLSDDGATDAEIQQALGLDRVETVVHYLDRPAASAQD